MGYPINPPFIPRAGDIEWGVFAVKLRHAGIEILFRVFRGGAVLKAVALEYFDCELFSQGIIGGEAARSESLAGFTDGVFQTAAEIGGEIGCPPLTRVHVEHIEDFWSIDVCKGANRLCVLWDIFTQ